jgi:hypothetical protein
VTGQAAGTYSCVTGAMQYDGEDARGCSGLRCWCCRHHLLWNETREGGVSRGRRRRNVIRPVIPRRTSGRGAGTHRVGAGTVRRHGVLGPSDIALAWQKQKSLHRHFATAATATAASTLGAGLGVESPCPAGTLARTAGANRGGDDAGVRVECSVPPSDTFLHWLAKKKAKKLGSSAQGSHYAF